MQDIFTEANLSAGAVYSHFTGKDEVIAAITDEVLDEISSAVDAALGSEEPPTLSEVLGQAFDRLQHAGVVTIAITVWGEAVHNPALGQRLATRYRTMHDRLALLVAIYQRRGDIDSSTPAGDVAHVLTALFPGFLSQLAFGANVNADTFNRGLRALLR